MSSSAWRLASSFVVFLTTLRIVQSAENITSISAIERLADIEDDGDFFYIANNALQWSKSPKSGGILLTGNADESTRQYFQVMNVNLNESTAVFTFYDTNICARKYFCLKSATSKYPTYTTTFSEELCVFEIDESLVQTEGRVNIFASNGLSANKINSGSNYLRFVKGRNAITHYSDDWNIIVSETRQPTKCPPIQLLHIMKMKNERFYVQNSALQWSKSPRSGGILLTSRSDDSSRQYFQVTNVNLTESTATFYFTDKNTCLDTYFCLKSATSIYPTYTTTFSKDLCVFEINDTLVQTEQRVNLFASNGKTANKINAGSNYLRFVKGIPAITHYSDDWNITVAGVAEDVSCSPTLDPTMIPTVYPSIMPTFDPTEGDDATLQPTFEPTTVPSITSSANDINGTLVDTSSAHGRSFSFLIFAFCSIFVTF